MTSKDELLSPEEVEYLLGRNEEADAAGEGNPPVDDARRLPPETRQELREHFERFGREFAVSLTGQLRDPARVLLNGIEISTRREFLAGLSEPACLCLLRDEGMSDEWLLEISPSVLSPMIDRLLGAGDPSTTPIFRPFTQIELRVAAKIVDLAVQCLNEGRDGSETRLRVEQMQCHPQGANAAEGDVIMVRLDLIWGAARGKVCLALPCY